MTTLANQIASHPTLLDDLRASALCEKIVSHVMAKRAKLNKSTYQRLVTELGRRFEIEAVESSDFDPQTGHLRGCGCDHCLREHQLAF